MKKLINKIMSWSQEARVGVVSAAVALLLIGGMSVARSWWAPTSNENPNNSTTMPSTNAPSTNENPVVLPVDEIVEKPFNVNATMARGYYEQNASYQERVDAMVFYDGAYRYSQGVDFVYENKEFNVLASSSGTVKDIAVDSVYGLTVTVECVNDIEIVYASLKSSPLQVGEVVDKGDAIGVAGESVYGSELGCPMLHFRIYKNDQVVNPNRNFGVSLKNVQ